MTQVLGFDPSLQTSVPLFNVGTQHTDELGRKYRYARANGNLTAGKTAQFTKDGTWDAVAMTTTTLDSKRQRLGVPDINVTDDYYAWFWIGWGDFECIIENSTAAGSVLTSTGTAGVPGAGGTNIDGFENIDAGVTDTRVTCTAYGELTAGVTAAYD